MCDRAKTAFITGGSSGIGRALATRLLSQDWRIFIVDQNTNGAKELAAQYNKNGDSTSPKVGYAECDVSSWTSQLSAFKQALTFLNKRIDFVAAVAGIGEKKWIPFREETPSPQDQEPTFSRPDLRVLDIDLTGVLYTLALSIQHLRRQSTDPETGFRGKIAVVASVCGFYAVPTLPIYTAAKHGLVGLVRTYGQLLPREPDCVSLNAVCPNIVATGISGEAFYGKVRGEGVLVDMEGVLEAFRVIIEGGGSAEVLECGPRGGVVRREGAGYLDGESRRSVELLEERGLGLHWKL